MVSNALIHEFDPLLPPQFDNDGDQLIGFYFQFTDEHDLPINGLIGPYRDRERAERACKRAFVTHDF